MSTKELEVDLDNYNVTYITNKTKKEGNIKDKSFNVLAIKKSVINKAYYNSESQSCLSDSKIMASG